MRFYVRRHSRRPANPSLPAGTTKSADLVQNRSGKGEILRSREIRTADQQKIFFNQTLEFVASIAAAHTPIGMAKHSIRNGSGMGQIKGFTVESLASLRLYA